MSEEKKTSGTRKAILIIAAVAVLYLVLQVFSFVGGGGSGPAAGSPAPAAATQALDGSPWRLEDQKGKVVLIDFWATWCPPCRASMPDMKAIHAEHKDNPDFVMVGVSLDRDQNALVSYCKEEKIEWLQLYESASPGDNAMAAAFGIRAIPSVWVIDRDGTIAGANVHGQELRDLLKKLLAKKPAPVPQSSPAPPTE